MNSEQVNAFLLMYKNTECFIVRWNKMADIKEEKTRFDIFFLLLSFFYAVEMKCVSFISLLMCNDLK